MLPLILGSPSAMLSKPSSNCAMPVMRFSRCELVHTIVDEKNHLLPQYAFWRKPWVECGGYLVNQVPALKGFNLIVTMPMFCCQCLITQLQPGVTDTITGCVLQQHDWRLLESSHMIMPVPKCQRSVCWIMLSYTHINTIMRG